MKKFNLFLLLLTCSILTLQAQPKIKFDKKNHDFGEVIVNTYPKTTFTFYNVGDKALILTNVKTSCGCTTPKWPRDSIMPGDSGKIQVVFNSRGYLNRNFAKTIIVSYNKDNGGTSQAEVLYIHGKVVPKNIPQYPLEIDTTIVDFDLLKYGKKAEIELTLMNTGDSTIQIKEILPSCENCMLVSIQPMTILPKQSAKMLISYLTKSHEPRSFEEKIIVKTNIKEKHLKQFSIKGIMVYGEVLKGKDYRLRIKDQKKN
jgi:hypothetical protein